MKLCTQILGIPKAQHTVGTFTAGQPRGGREVFRNSVMLEGWVVVGRRCLKSPLPCYPPFGAQLGAAPSSNNLSNFPVAVDTRWRHRLPIHPPSSAPGKQRATGASGSVQGFPLFPGSKCRPPPPSLILS